MNKINLWDETLLRQKYLITAGTNRYGREQYINYYSDTDDWDISVVPFPTLSKTKAIQLLPRIKREYKEMLEKNKAFLRRYKDIEFKLKEIE